MTGLISRVGACVFGGLNWHDVCCSTAKDENRKKQEEKKKAPKKVQGPAGAGGSVKMGKAGGAVMQPGRSSAPGKKSAR